jgi:hypothetical protein
LSEKVFTAGCHVGQKLSAASVIERARGIPEVSEILASSADWASFSVLTRNAATTILSGHAVRSARV